MNTQVQLIITIVNRVKIQIERLNKIIIGVGLCSTPLSENRGRKMVSWLVGWSEYAWDLCRYKSYNVMKLITCIYKVHMNLLYH